MISGQNISQHNLDYVKWKIDHQIWVAYNKSGQYLLILHVNHRSPWRLWLFLCLKGPRLIELPLILMLPWLQNQEKGAWKTKHWLKAFTQKWHESLPLILHFLKQVTEPGLRSVSRKQFYFVFKMREMICVKNFS